MRILGIDPGLRTLGWGVVDSHGSRLSHVANGLCMSRAGDDLAARLLSLYRQLAEVLARPADFAHLGPAARAHAVEHFDFLTRCLPVHVERINSLAPLARPIALPAT